MAPEPTKVIACDIRNGFGAARRCDAVEEARRVVPDAENGFRQTVGGRSKSATDSLGQHTGGQSANHGERWFLARRVSGEKAFALALPAALTATELEYWAYVVVSASITAGARCWAHLDEQGQHAQKCFIGGDRAKLHDKGCHIIHKLCCEAWLKSQREVTVPTLATEKRVDVDACRHPELPRIRLDVTVVDAETLHFSSAMRRGQEEAPAAAQAERTKASKYGRARGGASVTGISFPCSSAGGSAQDSTRSSTSLLVTSKQSAKQLEEMEDDHCKSGENF